MVYKHTVLVDGSLIKFTNINSAIMAESFFQSLSETIQFLADYSNWDRGKVLYKYINKRQGQKNEVDILIKTLK